MTTTCPDCGGEGRSRTSPICCRCGGTGEVSEEAAPKVKKPRKKKAAKPRAEPVPDTATGGIHITKLVVKNIKKIEALDADIDGSLVLVTGKNGQGKSTALDSIMLAVDGSNALKSHPEPVRRGADNALAEVHLDNGIVVGRKWGSKKGPGKVSLRTEDGKPLLDEDGKRITKTKDYLDQFLGRLSFDPMGFSNLPERERTTLLAELVGIDLAGFSTRFDKLFAERKAAHKDAQRLEHHVEELPPADVGEPAEEVSVSSLLGQHKLSERKRARVKELLDATKAARHAKQDAAQALELAKTVYAEADKALVDALNAESKIPGDLGEDPKVIQSRIDNAEKANAEARAEVIRRSTRSRAEGDATAARAEWRRLEDAVIALEEEKAAALREAVFPVDGLGFSDEGVTFNEVPFVQCSRAEQTKVSTAMAMKLNPNLRVILIHDGSLLDSDSMDYLKTLAIENDFQIIVEVVDDSDELGIIIEDGEVVS